MEIFMEKRYGIFTAIAMVVGIVIGSGVFFKAQTVLEKTGGDMVSAIIAFLAGGAVMLICTLTFSFIAAEGENSNGMIDYAKNAAGEKYAYYVGWFLSIIYYPSLTSVLAWLSARYTVVFIQSVFPGFGAEVIAGGGIIPASVAGPECMAIALFYMTASYAINALSPKLAGRIQVSATVIKLLPLVLTAVFGTIFGLSSGTLQQNFSSGVVPPLAENMPQNPLLSAIISVAFAYEGWIIASGISHELKNAKRNLPAALVIGSLIVVSVYVFYYIGISGGAPNSVLAREGAVVALKNIFGGFFGVVLNLFIVISCLGTLNGLMLACTRGIYALSARGEGIMPKKFSSIDKETNMPANSSVLGLLLCGAWFLYFYGANLAADKWFGRFCFDSSELPIITLYALYIPIFIMFMIKQKKLNIIKRFVFPLLAAAASVFMVYAAAVSHRGEAFYYLIVFAVIMLFAIPFRRRQR